MLGAEARLLPHAAELARLHAEELPQKDELCGAFQTLLTLRLAGIQASGDEPLDQDTVGRAAGSFLAPAGHVEELPPGEHRAAGLPPRASPRRRRGRGHVGRRPRARSRRALVGSARRTRPEGAVVRRDRRARSSSSLPPRRTRRSCSTSVPASSGARDPRSPSSLAYLESGDAAAGPPPDWTVGHFVGCLGTLRGARGTLVIINDTYATLGLRGVHLQPIERVAAALERKGMTPGGALLMLPGERRDAVSSSLTRAGIELGVWDNGSLDARQPPAADAPR